jgi:hypothetical protein
MDVRVKTFMSTLMSVIKFNKPFLYVLSITLWYCTHESICVKFWSWHTYEMHSVFFGKMVHFEYCFVILHSWVNMCKILILAHIWDAFGFLRKNGCDTATECWLRSKRWLALIKNLGITIGDLELSKSTPNTFKIYEYSLLTQTPKSRIPLT